MYCDNCGCELENNCRKCPVCGKEFPVMEEKQSKVNMPDPQNNQTAQNMPGPQNNQTAQNISVPHNISDVHYSSNGEDIMIKKKGEKKGMSKGTKITLISIPIIVVAAIVIFALLFVPKFKKYNDAGDKFTNGDIEGAVNLYKELGNFKNSFEQANGGAYYEYAKALEKDGRNLEAAEYYKKAENSIRAAEDSDSSKQSESNYSSDDASDKASQCFYNAGMDQMNAASYDSAIEAFKNAGTYKDADDKIIECTYKKAQSLIASGDYDNAINILTTIEDYSDSKTLLSQCYYNKGESFLKAGNYDDAYDMYIKSEYDDYKKKAGECVYNKASEYYKNKDYSNALKSYEKVDSSYKDCTAEKDKCYMALASESYGNKDYTKAIEYYSCVQNTDVSDKIVKSKIAYIKENKVASNETTMTYLGELRYAGNKAAQQLYSDIIKWDIESFVNTSETDMEKRSNSITVNDGDDIYIHTTYAFDGDDSMNITGYVVYSDGNKSGSISFSDAVVDGWSTWVKIEGDKVPKGVTYLYIQNEATKNIMEVYPFTIK